jgi:hypothetical protein
MRDDIFSASTMGILKPRGRKLKEAYEQDWSLIDLESGKINPTSTG